MSKISIFELAKKVIITRTDFQLKDEYLYLIDIKRKEFWEKLKEVLNHESN